MLSSILGLVLWPIARHIAQNGRKKDIESHRLEDLGLSSGRSATKSKKKKAQRALKESTSSKNEPLKEDPFLVCYLCGQQFPRKSLVSHIGHCLKTWRRREERKPLDEQLPIPEPPKQLAQPLPIEDSEIEQFNQIMRSSWQRSTNLRCQHCHKCFKAHVYHRHLKECLAVNRQIEQTPVLPEIKQHVAESKNSKKLAKHTSKREQRIAAVKNILPTVSKSKDVETKSSAVAPVASKKLEQIQNPPRVEKERKTKLNSTSVKRPNLSRESAPVKGVKDSKAGKTVQCHQDDLEVQESASSHRDDLQVAARSQSFSSAVERNKRIADSLCEQQKPALQRAVKSLKEKAINSKTTTKIEKSAPSDRKTQTVAKNKTTVFSVGEKTAPITEKQEPITPVGEKAQKLAKTEKSVSNVGEKKPTVAKNEKSVSPDGEKAQSTAKTEKSVPVVGDKLQTVAQVEKPLSTVREKTQKVAKTEKARSPDDEKSQLTSKIEKCASSVGDKSEAAAESEKLLSTVGRKDPAATKIEKEAANVAVKEKEESIPTEKKESRVFQKQVSLKEPKTKEESSCCKNTFKKSLSLGSRHAKNPIKSAREGEKEGTELCSSSSVEIPPPPPLPNPFKKAAIANSKLAEARTPLSERALKTGATPRHWRESTSGDFSFSARQATEQSGQLTDRPKGKSSKVPVAYNCYLCGRQFGSASLMIHIRQCRQLWEEQEALKPKKQDRRLLPSPPKELEDALPTDPEGIMQFNNAMVEYWESKCLIPCPNCARTFTEEAFEKHQRVCTAQNPGGPLGLSKHRPVNTVASPTSALLSERAMEESKSCDLSSLPTQYCCYLCGRQYGSQSLLLHIPRCQKLWVDREMQKPRKQDRRPLPEMPPLLEGFPEVKLPTDPENILAFNNTMHEYWDRVSLIVCQICGRSFKEDSFEKHQKMCTVENPGGVLGPSKQRPDTFLKSLSLNSREVSRVNRKPTPRALVCYLCGRQYGTGSLMIHLPHCQKQWQADEALKPKEYQRSLPSPPEEIVSGEVPTLPEDMEKFNNAMTAFWEEHTLMKCKICNRRFNYDAYLIHIKNCSSSESRPMLRRTLSSAV